MDTAETAMLSDDNNVQGKQKRSEISKPCDLDNNSRHAERNESKILRRLRRQRRRRIEYEASCIYNTINKYAHNHLDLVKKFPELHSVEVGMDFNAEIKLLDRLICEIMESDSNRNLHDWHYFAMKSEKALMNYCKEGKAAHPDDKPTMETKAQQAGEKRDMATIEEQILAETEKFEAIWNAPRDHFNPEDLERFLTWVPAEGFQIHGAPWNVTAEMLKKTCKASQASAAGTDQWRPMELARLPMMFFDALARLWNSLMAHGGGIPKLWKTQRVNFIPAKPWRPIAIAQAMWRCCSSLTVRNLRDWTTQWCHQTAVGGVAGIEANELHERVHAALAALDENSALEMIAAHIDRKKSFDHVDFRVTIHLLERYGPLKSIENMLRDFYTDQVL